MARIIVTADHAGPGRSGPVLLDESVYSVHLSSGHAAMQLIQRLGWALSDAEEVERTDAPAISPSHAEPRGRELATSA